MEFVQGICLYDVWDSLEAAQKDRLAHQLRQHFRELRQLRGDFIGSVNNGPCKDIFFDEAEDKGPFATEARMNAVIVETVRKSAGFAEGFVPCTLLGMSQNHAIVFSHGNIDVSHVIVDERHEQVRAIVGWQRAGFFPEYWEFVNALSLTLVPFRSDWVLYAQKFLEPRYAEYPTWCLLRMRARWRMNMTGR